MADLKITVTLKGTTGDVINTICSINDYNAATDGNKTAFANAKISRIVHDYYTSAKGELAREAAKTAVTI
jgi:hypothetical protein